MNYSGNDHLHKTEEEEKKILFVLLDFVTLIFTCLICVLKEQIKQIYLMFLSVQKFLSIILCV